MTFEPSVNLATPVDYHLGPGDEVIIDIWGTNQATIRDNISPDGYINIEDIGLVYLNGMTVTDKGDTGRQPHHSGKCDGGGTDSGYLCAFFFFFCFPCSLPCRRSK